MLFLFDAGVLAQTPPPPPGYGVPARARHIQAFRPTPVEPTANVPAGGTIKDIKIIGNQRVEAGTIRSYMTVVPGDPFDPDRIDRSLKTLFATGLFSDVSLTREGDTLVVKVVENPTINRVAFEGNHKLTDDNLKAIVQLRSRGVFTPEIAESDRQRILDAYAKKGRYDARVEPKIIKLPDNRVDVVFEINEGNATLISRIAFVGNHEFSESRLREVITSRQTIWWRFLTSADTYDPARVNFDKEELRHFYLQHGYVDFEVVNVSAELSPDRKSFFVTFTIDEGERYRVAKITINSQLRKLDGDSLRPDLQIDVGDWYDGEAVERSVTAMSDDVLGRGYPFVDIKPRITRDKAKHTVDLVFDVTEGPRIYVERIDITGNTRTEDKVIRREFRFAEGDAFNAAAARKTKQRLDDLGYFSNVQVVPSPGSAPDKAIVTAQVVEKATGELTLGGGFSTDVGPLIDAGIREKNFVGTGIDAAVNGVLATKRSSITASVTDPYFLDRNLVAGADVFYVNQNNTTTALYSEQRLGFALRAGYQFSDHLRQAINYSIVDRDVYNVSQPSAVEENGPYGVTLGPGICQAAGAPIAALFGGIQYPTCFYVPPYVAEVGGASYYIRQQAGWTLLSQFGQTLTLDYRDSPTDPHTGFIVRAGLDAAGAGGDETFVRGKLDGTYFVPLDYFTGNRDWGISFSGGIGNLWPLGSQEQIIDRFFLGGDNLRGFEAGGAGPHDATTGDSLGGRFIWTGSAELHYPLPISQDIGISGRAFVDVGGLTEANFESGHCPNSGLPYAQAPGAAPNSAIFTQFPSNGTVCPPIYDHNVPRLGAGVGISWNTPFGLINIDVAPFVIKQTHDQTQLFRFGFGTRF